jgi:hypothetical protein
MEEDLMSALPRAAKGPSHEGCTAVTDADADSTLNAVKYLEFFTVFKRRSLDVLPTAVTLKDEEWMSELSPAELTDGGARDLTGFRSKSLNLGATLVLVDEEELLL